MHKQTTMPCHTPACPSHFPRSQKLLAGLTTLVVMGLAIGTPAARADDTWTGAGGNSSWSNGSNWNNGDPNNNYGTLYFNNNNNGQTTIYNDSVTSMNQLKWYDSSSWTLNQSGTTILSLYDNGGTQAKIENYSTGLVTINLPITFAANNPSSGNNPNGYNPWGEINAASGNITFGAGSLTVNGSSVNGIRMYGGGHTTTFNNTVSASGKYFDTVGSGTRVAIGGAFTSGDFYLMNGGTLSLNSGGSFNTSGLRLGGDFGTTGSQDLTQGATFNLAATSGGQTFSGLINTISSNTSGNLNINSQNVSGTNTIFSSIYLDSNLNTSTVAGGTLILSGPIDLKAQTLTVSGSGNTIINSVVQNSTGSGNLTKQGNGTLTLTKSNTYTGVTSINGGTLAVGTLLNSNSSGGTLGSSSNAASSLSLDGGTLQFTGASTSLGGGNINGTTNRLFTLGNRGGTLNASNGALVFTNIGSILTTTATVLTLTGDGIGANVFNPLLSDANTTVKTTLNKSGNGTWTLTNTNSYTGGTTVNGGTLTVIGSIGTGDLNVSNSSSASSAKSVIIDFNAASGTTQNVSSLSGTVSGTAGNTATVQVETGNTLAVNQSTDSTYGGNISGAGNLTKTGSGMLTIAGGNTSYTGATAVNGGALSGAANSYGSGAVTVASGATVDYTQSGTGTATNNISGTGSATFGSNTGSANGSGGTINYTGTDSVSTTVQSGTATLANQNGAALSGPVAVATGATLQLNSGNGNGTTTGAGNTPFQIAVGASPSVSPTVAAVTLNGGKLSTNGYSDGAINPTTAAVSSSMGALKLGMGTSQIDFGGMSGLLAFADSRLTLGSGNLDVINYAGGVDALYIGTTGSLLNPSQLKQIAINGMGVSQLDNGRIIPAAAPEPSGMVTGLVGAGALGGVIFFRRRRAGRAITENG